MKKLITSICIVGLMLYLPLWKNPELILDLRLVSPTVVSLWLLLKQKALDIKQITKYASTDGYSTIVIILVGMLTQAISIYEWSLNGKLATQTNLQITVGYLLHFGGLYLRVLAIDTLDRYFTNEVRVGSEWKLIRHGIYKYIRHPSYTGAICTMVGTPVLFECYHSLWISLTLITLIYSYRIYLEEKELIRHFGEEYREYMKKTSAILPFLY